MNLDALYEEVLLLPDDEPTKVPRLKTLNDTFLRIWDDAAEINRAILTLTKATRLASDLHKPAIQSNLGGLFAHRFAITRDVADIEEQELQLVGSILLYIYRCDRIHPGLQL
jgi:hypothetical protein